MDIFGACFCILALSMVKLSSIKIATMLLVAVFFYDIFFVFLTPLFMGQSVMITVAKGGSTGVGGDDFCVKYPDDKDCTGIDFLPMLLAVPRINDYRGGMALLGLGDIVCKWPTFDTFSLPPFRLLISSATLSQCRDTLLHFAPVWTKPNESLGSIPRLRWSLRRNGIKGTSSGSWWGTASVWVWHFLPLVLPVSDSRHCCIWFLVVSA